MIVGYARVSTDKAEQDISIAAQVRQLRDAGCDRVIRERGSAYKDGSKRPGWDELQALVASGQVREVVAVSQSRLSRRGEEVAFLRICARLGVTVRFLDGTPGDVTDPAGRLLTGVLSTVNEVDSLIKSINVRNGLQRRRAEGHYACGRVPYGYQYDGSRVVANPETWADARLLWDQLVKAEMNPHRVIRLCDRDWSVRGLYRWVQNPILRGIVNGEAGAVEALVTWEEWQRAMAVRDARRRVQARAPRETRLFSGLVRCAGCDGRLHYLYSFGKRRLKCTKHRCPFYGRGLAEWKVREQVIEALRVTAERLGKLAAVPVAAEDPQAGQWRLQLQQLQQLRAQGVQGLEGSIEELQGRLLVPPLPSVANWQGLAAVLSQPGVLEGIPDEEFRVLLLEYLSEVVYIGDPNRVEVRLRDGAGDGAA
jgi:DNA invertase Pin-like site-specific DNA recombinase